MIFLLIERWREIKINNAKVPVSRTTDMFIVDLIGKLGLVGISVCA